MKFNIAVIWSAALLLAAVPAAAAGKDGLTGATPYQKNVFESKIGTDSATANFGTIPAGMRLVIEHVSVNTLQSSTDQPVVCSLILQDSVTGVMLVPLQAPTQVTSLRKVISQRITAYADTGVSVSCLKLENASGNAGLLSVGAYIVGELVAK